MCLILGENFSNPNFNWFTQSAKEKEEWDKIRCIYPMLIWRVHSTQSFIYYKSHWKVFLSFSGANYEKEKTYEKQSNLYAKIDDFILEFQLKMNKTKNIKNVIFYILSSYSIGFRSQNIHDTWWFLHHFIVIEITGKQNVCILCTIKVEVIDALI